MNTRLGARELTIASGEAKPNTASQFSYGTCGRGRERLLLCSNYAWLSSSKLFSRKFSFRCNHSDKAG